jgi:hypothetical protein
MDASQLPKQISGETNSDRQINLPGVYVHKDSGAKYITPPGEDGVIHADQLMSPIWEKAWERVGDVPTREELLAMQKAQAENEALIEGKSKADKLPAGGETYDPKATK